MSTEFAYLVADRTRSLAGLPQGSVTMKGGIYQERTASRVGLVALSIVAIGIAFIRVAEFIPSDWPTWKPIVSSVGGLLVASVGLALLWELRVKRAFVDEIFDAAKIASEIKAAKIVGVTTEFMTDIDWARYIDSAKELDVMFFGGGTWRNAFSIKLGELFKRPGAKVNLILPDPNSAVVRSELSRRFGYTEDEITRRILESEEFFRELAQGSTKSVLKIWYLDASPLFTFYRLDNFYVLATYRHKGKGKIPAIVCHKGGSLADFLDEQIESMTDKKFGLAKLIFPCAKPSDSIQTDTSAVVEDVPV